MLLDLNLTYIYKKNKTLVKVLSKNINLIGKGQEVCVEVFEVNNRKNTFLCPVALLASVE